MISGHIVAAEMAREATRWQLTEPRREPRPRRRLAALLGAVAYRLDIPEDAHASR